MDGAAKGQLVTASARLPERQREALELRELQGLSYKDIAARLETTWACVGQLIAHGRINLYDELHGTILASVAPSPDCERALSLIAAREDGELGDPVEASWLDAHLEGCGRCRRGVEEMREAATAYRATTSDSAMAGTATVTSSTSAAPVTRRRVTLAAAVACLLLFAGVAAAVVRDGSPPTVEPAVSVADRASPTPGDTAKGKDERATRKERHAKASKKAVRGEGTDATAAPAAPIAPVTSEVPVAAPDAEPPTGGGGGDAPNRPTGRTAIDPPQRTAAPKPKPAPDTSSPTPSTAPVPAPVAESPPVDEPADEPPHGREPPGKPAHAGPK
ncbi:MAG TPA: sigma factor-like helix-turn-helix DNA-binding protein [Solirubrobacterales bacterium]|nr:sigma factor-like helix-turn-helix DNA-binding protein [Solirubrobacterales bacterium]